MAPSKAPEQAKTTRPISSKSPTATATARGRLKTNCGGKGKTARATGFRGRRARGAEAIDRGCHAPSCVSELSDPRRKGRPFFHVFAAAPKDRCITEPLQAGLWEAADRSRMTF